MLHSDLKADYFLLVAPGVRDRSSRGVVCRTDPCPNGVRATINLRHLGHGRRQSGLHDVEHARVEGSEVSSLESDALRVDPATLTVAIFRSSNAIGGAVPSAGPS